MFAKKALVILLICVFLKELAWVTFVPLWQTPDEQAHFAQVSMLSETKSLDIPQKNLSSEILQAEIALGVVRNAYGNNKYTYHPEFNIPYASGAVGPRELELAQLPKSSRVEFTRNEAAAYPPMYYVLTAPFYLAFSNGSIFDRVFAVRLVNLFSIVTLAFVVYKIGQLIFPKNNGALHLSILVSFLPMLSFVHAGVTSDALFILLFTIFLWQSLLLLKDGLSIRRLAFISLVIVAGFLTKPQANIMAFILGPLIVALILVDKNNSKFIFPSLILFGLSAFGIIYRISQGASLIPESTNALNFSPTSIVEHLSFTLYHAYREVLPWFWGVFRWLSLGLPDYLRKITSWLTILSFAGFALYIFQELKSKRMSKEFLMAIFLAFAFVVYFLAITAFDFGFRQSHGFSFGIQGRYFFPVIVPMMTIFLIGLKFGRLLAILMILFNIFVFFWVTSSYYQFSFPEFFMQASQYKPLWLKFPLNAIILFGFIISSLVLIRFSHVKKAT